MGMKKLSLAILALFLTVAAAEAQIVINEIMYNPPESGSDTTEYIELYNAGATAVDIQGWHFTAGVEDSVDVSTVIPAGGYFVWTVNGAAFQNTYGQAADREWASGGLRNGGEAIVIADASGVVMDSVNYDDGGNWPAAAGTGNSLALCDATTNNADVANWTTDSTNTGLTVSGKVVFASPGAANTTNCVVNTTLTVEFLGTQRSVDENVGTVTIDLAIQNPNATATTVEVTIGAASTAVAADYTNFNSPVTVTFPANSTTNQSFTIDIVDDADQEALETIIFELGNATNGAVIGTNNSYTLNINANDIAAVPVPNVVITEILYDQVGSDTIEFIELYNNGSTTADLSGFYFDGVTYTVPNGTTLAAGAYWVLTMDSVALQAVTGVTANQWSSGALSNGGEDIVFYTIAGDIVDSVNYGYNTPWPLRDDNVAIQLSDVNADNNDAANWCYATNNAGTTGRGDILYATPGAANTACAAPGVYVYSRIDQIDGLLLPGNVPASEGDSVELRGLVYCADFRSGNGLDFALIETASTNGIRVYAPVDINNYTVNAGDSIRVFGRINNYNGLLQVLADSIDFVSAGNATLSPVEVTALSEATENKLIELNNLTLVDPSQWTGTGSGFAVEATNGTDTFDLYIDNDVDLYTQPAPTGAFKVYGFGGQYDPSNPYDEGYQLLPCNSSITPLTSVSFTEQAPVRIYPNPAQDRLFVEAEAVDAIQVYNNLGQLLIRLDNLQTNRQEINLSQLEAGVYHLNIIRNGQSSSQSFIKQ